MLLLWGKECYLHNESSVTDNDTGKLVLVNAESIVSFDEQ